MAVFSSELKKIIKGFDLKLFGRTQHIGLSAFLSGYLIRGSLFKRVEEVYKRVGFGIMW